jgi:hypothetical protein
MGSRKQNFYNQLVQRYGFEDAAKEVQDLYLDGKKDEAAREVPLQLIEDTALIGPKEKIRDDIEKWRESVVGTLLVSGDVDTLRTMAELTL